MGLLQIKPSLGESVARDIGIAWRGPSQLHDPDKNIRIGVHHLSQLIDMFGTLPCALHAYNKGSARAKGEAARRQAPNARFTAAVMKEYSKTLTILPHPDDHND
jgi:soluble lytic murein transglycosylase